MSSSRQSHFVVCKKPKIKPKIPQKTPRFLYFSSALAICITSLTPLASVNSKAVECKDIQAVFARGSGEKAKTNINYQKFKDNLIGVLQSANKSYDFYDLGESNQYKYQYPAVSVENLGAIADTYIHAGKNDYFNNSVTTGIKEMQTLYQEITHRCPNTKFILGGYSQGAIVMTRAIRTLDPEKIIYLSTFGDPKLHLPEGEGKDKPCYHGIHSDYRINVPDCDVEHGVLGAQKPYLPNAKFSGKIGTWCNSGDFMCGSFFDPLGLSEINLGKFQFIHQNLISGHLAYAGRDAYAESAHIVGQILHGAKKLAKPGVLKVGYSSHFIKQLQNRLAHPKINNIDHEYIVAINFNKANPAALSLQYKKLISNIESRKHRHALFHIYKVDFATDHHGFAKYQKITDFNTNTDNLLQLEQQLKQHYDESNTSVKNASIIDLYQAIYQISSEQKLQHDTTKGFILSTPAEIYFDYASGEYIQKLKYLLEAKHLTPFIINGDGGRPEYTSSVYNFALDMHGHYFSNAASEKFIDEKLELVENKPKTRAQNGDIPTYTVTFDGNNFSITNTYTDKPLRLQQDHEHYATKFVEFEDLRPKIVELEFKGRKWRAEITPLPTKISDPNYHHETKQKLLIIDGVAQGFTSSDSLNFDKLNPTKAHHILIHHIGDDARIYKTEEQNIPIKDSEPDKADDSEGSDNPSNSGDSNKTNDSSNPSNPNNPSNSNNSTNPDPSEPPKPPEEPEDNHFGDLLRELDILKHNAFSEQTENLTDRLRGIFNKKSEDKKESEGKMESEDKRESGSGKPDKQKTDNKPKPDKHSNSEKNNENHNNNSDTPNTENRQEDHSSHPSIISKEKSNHQTQPDSTTTQYKDAKKLIPAVPDSGIPRYLKRRLYSK